MRERTVGFDMDTFFAAIVVLIFASIVAILAFEAYEQSPKSADEWNALRASHMETYHDSKHGVTCYFYDNQPVNCIADSLLKGVSKE